MDRNAKRPDQGNEVGAYLKIVRLENGWIVTNSNLEQGIMGSGKEWVFQDPRGLCDFIAKWAQPELKVSLVDIPPSMRPGTFIPVP
jgi:hypothetical protein